MADAEAGTVRSNEPISMTREDSAYYPVEPGPIAPIPTPVPSLAPVPRPTVSPQQQLLSYGPTASGASWDIVDGNRTLGDCYSVERYTEFTSSNPMTGCVFQIMSLTYYGGGMNSSFDDSGIEQVVFETIFIDSVHGCTNEQDNRCALYGSCAGCEYLGDWLVELDNSTCTPEDATNDALGSDSQIVSFFYDYDPTPYANQFFKLQDGRCT